nr:hypothetical protein [Tanacetum cinerariifolium]
MSSDDASFAVTYTSVSSEARSWSIPTEDPYEDPYEEAARQALEQAPYSPGYVPYPMELKDHAPVYVLKPECPEYLALSDDDILVEDQLLPADASLEEQESSKDEEEEEEHLAPVAYLAVDLVPFVKDTKLFEIDESTATPLQQPAYLVTARMSIRSQTPILFPFEEEVARLLSLPTPPLSSLTPLSSPLSQIPSPPISPTYAQVPLDCKAAMMRATPSPIPLPSSFLPSPIRPPYTRAAMAQMRAATPSTYHSLLPAETPSLLPIPLPAPSTSRRAKISEADMPVDYSFVDTMDASIRSAERRTMAAIEVVNLREDHAALRAEIRVLRRERLAYEQESSETRQALARSKAHNRALEARIEVLETQTHHHEWQCQDTIVTPRQGRITRYDQ